MCFISISTYRCVSYADEKLFMRRNIGSEEDLSFMLARYMQLQHPGILYHFDYGSGTKLTMGQAIKQKRLNKRAWPDLFIAAYRYTKVDEEEYSGLFIELKKEGTKLYLKDGKTMVANPHYQEQALTLQALEFAGYKAVFACGYNEAVKVISEYLGV